MSECHLAGVDVAAWGHRCCTWECCVTSQTVNSCYCGDKMLILYGEVVFLEWRWKEEESKQEIRSETGRNSLVSSSLPLFLWQPPRRGHLQKRRWHHSSPSRGCTFISHLNIFEIGMNLRIHGNVFFFLNVIENRDVSPHQGFFNVMENGIFKSIKWFPSPKFLTLVMIVFSLNFSHAIC